MPTTTAPSPRPSGILKQSDSSDCVSPSSLLDMNYTISPRSTPKSVSYAQGKEMISPLILGNQKSVDEIDLERTPRKAFVKGPGAKRLSGRPPLCPSPGLKPLSQTSEQAPGSTDSGIPQITFPNSQVEALLEKVQGWIHDERAKRGRLKRFARKAEHAWHDAGAMIKGKDHATEQKSDDEEEPDFDKLEDILKRSLNLERLPSRRSLVSLRQRSSTKKLSHRKASTIGSDTDYFDSNDFHVPSCDVVLDNSQTLAYTGGHSDESDVYSGDELTRVPSYRDQDAWAKFKFEITRLAHTLRLKGWRKVPMEMSGGITVQRLSGALTNAVYVVSPPGGLPPREVYIDGGGTIIKQPKVPPKLLLRIYGPQVEHLIDRESELAILRRLARKRIGPRLLGTFANGRFEEFFNAQTLTAADIRNPETSIQIAKRMRELHQGIELLEQERADGPFVWCSWDRWLDRVEQVVQWLDAQIRAMGPDVKPTGADAWKRRGYILGVPWKVFRDTVEKYREWLNDQYGGIDKIRERLVFAHNDTQYGNILRMIPTGESPLLLPANTHKQLIVIDFEYSNANLPGLEFANHFTEWCYNYHDERKPYACHTNRYPTPEEQERFLRAYIQHCPQISVASPKVNAETPTVWPVTPFEPARRPTSSITEFMLDARAPYTPPQQAPPASCEEATEKASEDLEVKRLIYETRLWRLANSAMWVAWGTVQAKVPGMPDFPSTEDKETEAEKVGDAAREDLGEDSEDIKALARVQSAKTEPDEQEEEFDYLGYAQHRAMFFWGDALQLGIVKKEELPDGLLEKIKSVPY
ncbi:kinase-like protein, partial [Teratosphaeria nubilosa]